MLSYLAPILRLFLAVVFAVAGAAKAFNLAASRKTVSDFGLPVWLAAPIGNLLPFVEIGIAALFLPGWSAWWSALSALTLLAAFAAAMIANLARGRTPSCNCFGRIQTAPIGWSSVVRNVVLAACAAVIVAGGPGTESSNAVTAFAATLGVGSATLLLTSLVTITIGGQAFFLWHILRQHGRLLLRIEAVEQRMAGTPANLSAHGLAVGAVAPPFQLPSASGAMSGLAALRDAGLPTVLIFTDLNCGPCKELMPEIARWQQTYAAHLRIALVSRGDELASRAIAEHHALRNVLLQHANEVADSYKIVGTPAAVVVNRTGSIGTQPAMGRDAIAQLFLRLEHDFRRTERGESRDAREPLEHGAELTYGTAAR